MRILRVVHRLYPPTVGGLSFYAHMLSAGQAKLGHDVVVLTTQEGGMAKHEYRDGYEIYRFRPLARPLDNPLTLSMLPKLFLHEEFDILHAHSHLMFTTWLAAMRKHFCTAPFVITNHGFRVKRGRMLDYAQNAYLTTLGRFALTSADRVISFTGAERKRTIMAGVRPDRAIIIANGVDTRFFAPVRERSVPHSVLWTGRFVPEKGVRYLIEAARIVTAKFPDSKFMFVGDGDCLPNLVQLRRELGLVNNVVLLPEMDQKSLLCLLNNCTVFALPSLSEGFPSSVLEAMSCEMPVIVTAGIGLEEVVGDAGLYVPAKNANALAEAIATLFGNESLAIELGRNGRSRVLARYDWQDIVRRVNDLFKEIIDASQGEKKEA